MHRQPRLIRTFKIPDPPVAMNVWAAAADQGSGTHVHNTGTSREEQRKVSTAPNIQPARHTTLARTLAHLATGMQQGFMTIDQGATDLSTAGTGRNAEIDAMDPCMFERPCISTSEGHAEAHRSFQAFRREYDEACAASGKAPEAGELANFARICAPLAALHIAGANFSPALLGPRHDPGPADMVVDMFTHGYEHNATVQRIRNAWNRESLYEHFHDLNSSPITVARSRLSWVCVFFDMTHIPDTRFAEGADPALKHRLQEQQKENTRHVGSHPRILHELSVHVEFVEHCRYIFNVLIDCIHTGVEVVNLSV